MTPIERIKKAILSGISQSELSRRTNGLVSQKTISNIVNERCSPQWDKIEAIVSALDEIERETQPNAEAV